MIHHVGPKKPTTCSNYLCTMVKAWYVVYGHPSRIVGILIEASLIPKLYNDNDNIDSTTCSQVKELLSMGADTDAKDKLLISTGFDQKKSSSTTWPWAPGLSGKNCPRFGQKPWIWPGLWFFFRNVGFDVSEMTADWRLYLESSLPSWEVVNLLEWETLASSLRKRIERQSMGELFLVTAAMRIFQLWVWFLSWWVFPQLGVTQDQWLPHQKCQLSNDFGVLYGPLA